MEQKKFKHYKEAEARAAEVTKELEALSAEITTGETEARSEDIDTDTRGELIKALKTKTENRAALQTELDEVMAVRDKLKAQEDEQLGLLNNLTTPRVTTRRKAADDGEDDITATRAYELAWARCVRTGNDAEVRNLVSTAKGAPTNAGILVPRTLVERIEDVLKTGGRIMNLCSTSAIKGITEYPIAKSYTDPALHDETGSTPKVAKAIEFDSVTMEPQYIAEILTTTRKFEADSIEAFWDWVMEELPDALRRVIDTKILTGGQAAKDGIHGILTNTNARFVETLAGHTLNFNTANQAVAMLGDGIEDNVTFVMNRKTFYNNVMSLTGTDGHPIFQQVMNTNLNRPQFMMGGYPVVFSNILPAYADAAAGQAYIVAGDFRAMRLNFPSGMNPRMIRDEITLLAENKVRYLSEIYVAGNIARLESFVKVTKA